MEPVTLITISASLAAGAAIGWVGGRRQTPGPTEIPTTLRASDDRAERLGRENQLLRRISGLDDVPPMKTDTAFMGGFRDRLEDRLADVLTARAARAAAFFDEHGLLVAGSPGDDSTKMMAKLLTTIRPPATWRSLRWHAVDGTRLMFDSLSLGGVGVRLGVLARAPLAEAILGRTRFALEGLQAAPPLARLQPVSSSECTLKSTRRMAVAHDFLGLVVIDEMGQAKEAIGARSPRETTDVWRATTRLARTHDAFEPALTLSWTDETGKRFALHPFDSRDGEGLLLTVTQAAEAYPHERIRQWTRQIAREVTELGKQNGGGE